MIHNSEIVAEGDKVLVGGIRSQPKAEILVNLFRVLLIQQPLQSGHPGRCQVTVLEKNPSTVLQNCRAEMNTSPGASDVKLSFVAMSMSRSAFGPCPCPSEMEATSRPFLGCARGCGPSGHLLSAHRSCLDLASQAKRLSGETIQVASWVCAR